MRVIILTKGWHNKHISTKWGVSILGLLVFSLLLLIPVLQKSQNIQSEAAYNRSDPQRVVDCLNSNRNINVSQSTRNRICRGNLISARVDCSTGRQSYCYADAPCTTNNYPGVKNILCSDYIPSTACSRAGGTCIGISSSGVGFCGDPRTKSKKGYSLTTAYKCANDHQICCKKK